MIDRQLSKRLIELMGKYPIVTLTGPRQSGKSTLLRNTFKEYQYVSLEDPDKRLMATAEPRGFLNQYRNKTIIDEAQRAPELFSYLQTHTDNIGEAGMYLLAGSQNFLLMEKISQTLAGRTAVLKLLPFSMAELKNAQIDVSSADKWIYTGGYPRIYDKNIVPKDFYPFYFQTYIERDVRQIKNILDHSLFIRFIKLCAGRIGQLLNLSSLANDCGISQPTAQAWISLLETSYIIYLLKPHHRNFNKRLVKTPKLYFFDTGLACYLLDIESEKQLENHYLRGSLFENIVLLEYIKYKYNRAEDSNCYFWRDKSGNEVDMMLEHGGHLTAIEIKSGITFTKEYFKGIDYLEKISNHEINNKLVIFNGSDKLSSSKGDLIPWTDVNNIWPNL